MLDEFIDRPVIDDSLRVEYLHLTRTKPPPPISPPDCTLSNFLEISSSSGLLDLQIYR